MTLQNARHERFAQLLAEGRSQSAAYREVFPRSRRWTGAGLHPEASRLSRKVSARVSELQAEIAKQVCIEKAEVVRLLASVLQTPIGEITPKSPLCQRYQVKADGTVVVEMLSKMAAADLICKLLGYYAPEKHEHDGKFQFAPDSTVFQAMQRAAVGSNLQGPKRPVLELNVGGAMA